MLMKGTHKVPENRGREMRKRRNRGETKTEIRRKILDLRKDTSHMMKAKIKMRWG